MKTNQTGKKFALVLAICGAGNLVPALRADTILFNPISGVSWSTVANWTDNGVTVTSVPNGTDAVVEFVGPGTQPSGSATSSYSVTLGSASTSTTSFTVGTMTLDGGTAGKVISINNGILVFSVSSGSAQLTSKAPSTSSTVYGLGANLLLNSPFILEQDGNAAQVTGFSIGGNISGSASFTKNGPGAVSMASTPKSGFFGQVTINDGQLRLSAAGRMSNAGDVTVNPGGQLLLDGSLNGSSNNGDMSFGSGSTIFLSGSGVTDPGFTSITGALTTAAGALRYSDAASGAGILISNSVVLVPNAGTGPTLYIGAASSALSLTGPMSGSTGFYKTGAGTLALTSNASTFSGPTFIQTGAISISNDRSLGAVPLSASDNVYINDGAGLSGSGPSSFALNVNRSITLGTPGVSGTAGSTFSVISGQTMTINGLIHDNTVAGTTGKLKVTGPGIIALTAANTYTGGTSISGGTLLVNNIANSGTGTGGVTVTSGTLGGSGSVSGPVTLGNAAQLSPGSAASTVGTFTVASFAAAPSLTSGTTLNIEVSNAAGTAGSGYDFLSVTNAADLTNLTSSAKLTVNLIGLAGIQNFDNTLPDTWTVLTAGNLIGFSASNTAVASSGSLAFGLLSGGTFSLSSSGNSIFVQYSPATAAPRSLTWTAGTSTTWSTTHTDTNWSDQANPVPATYFNNSDTVSFLGTPPSGGVVAIVAGGVSPASVIVSNTGTFTFSGGPINGGGNLVKSNVGTLALTQLINGYSGGTTITGGVVSIVADTSLGAPVGGVIINGGSLVFAGNVTSTRSFTFGAAGATIDTGTFSGTLSPPAPISTSGIFTKAGTGELAIATNGFTGSGTITATGTLTLGDTTAATADIHNFIPATMALSLNNAVLQLVGDTTAHQSFSASSIFVAGTSTIQAYHTSGGSNFTDPVLSAPITLNGHLIFNEVHSPKGYDQFVLTSITETGDSTIEDTAYNTSDGSAIKLNGAFVDNGFTTTFLSGATGTQPDNDFSSNIQLTATTGNIATGNWVLGLPDGSNGASVSADPTAYTTGSSVTIFKHSALNIFTLGTYGTSSQTIDVYGNGAVTDDLQTGDVGAIASLGTGANAGLHTLNSNLRLDSDPSSPVIIAANTVSPLAITGNISGTGQFGEAATFGGAGTIILSGTNTYQGGTFLFAGTLQVNNIPTQIPVAGGLTINTGATLAVAPIPTAHVSPAVLPTSFFNIAPGGTINLTNNDLIITGGASQAMAYNAAMSPAVPSGTAPGVAMATTGVMTWSEYQLFNPTQTSFDGNSSLTSDDLIFRYGYAGDATGDGVINIDDYLLIDGGYLSGAPVDYVHGNFIHAADGLVTAADYALIDYDFHAQSGTLADAEISLHTAEFGQAYIDAFNSFSPTPIPEPASLALLALGTAALLHRRKR